MSKTIKISDEDYARLDAVRKPTETVSDVLSRYLSAVELTNAILDGIRKANLSDATLDAAEDAYRQNRGLPPRRRVVSRSRKK